ncbi:MAG: hypothetical protein ACI9BD_000416 [Candidatus Marinamargulisbacteria bacterium]|jgi:hypothetical protein
MKAKHWLIALLFFAFGSSIFATCGAATCPVLGYMGDLKKPFEMKLDFEQISQDNVFVGNDLSSVGAISQHHDEVETLSTRWVIGGRWQVIPGFSVRVELPYISRTHTHIHNHHGAQLRDTWNFSGMGDAWVLFDKGAFDHFGATIGVKLPTGKTDASNDDGDLAEVAIQPGSGSTDYFGSLSYKYDFFRSSVGFRLNGTGTQGWQNGNEVTAQVGGVVEPWTNIQMSLDGLFRKQAEAKAGSTGESTAGTGGTFVYINPSVMAITSEHTKLEMTMQFPIYQKVNGIQLVSPWNLRAGFAVEI